MRKNSAVTVRILANSATRQQLGVHHVNAPASTLGASRFIDEVADLAWVLDAVHGHDPSARCVFLCGFIVCTQCNSAEIEHAFDNTLVDCDVVDVNQQNTVIGPAQKS